MKELQFYPLALLGNFQRYGVLRLGKFPNKLWYFLSANTCGCIGLHSEPFAFPHGWHLFLPLGWLYPLHLFGWSGWHGLLG